MKKITTTFVAGFAMLALASPLYAANQKNMTTDTQQQAGSSMSNTQQQAGSGLSGTQQAGASKSLTAEDLKDFEVYSQTGEEIGKITEVRIDEQSREVKFVTLTRGGVLGVGGKDIAVPLGAFNIDRENERATLTVSESMLDNAPVQTDKSDLDFHRDLSNHYGIAPDWKTPGTGETQMDQSQKPVPDSAPGLETGSPQIRDKSNQPE